jgi:hypothetical protein
MVLCCVTVFFFVLHYYCFAPKATGESFCNKAKLKSCAAKFGQDILTFDGTSAGTGASAKAGARTKSSGSSRCGA